MRAKEFEEMDEAKKEQERERLRDIVFEGAYLDCEKASMGRDGIWHNHGIELNESMGIFHPRSWLCKNQPETFLQWDETLIKRTEIHRSHNDSL